MSGHQQCKVTGKTEDRSFQPNHELLQFQPWGNGQQADMLKNQAADPMADPDGFLGQDFPMEPGLEFSGLTSIPLALAGGGLQAVGMGDALNETIGGGMRAMEAVSPALQGIGNIIASQPGPQLLTHLIGQENLEAAAQASGTALQVVDDVLMMKGLGAGARALGTGLDVKLGAPGSVFPSIDHPPGAVVRHSGPGGLFDPDPMHGLMDPEPVRLSGLKNQHLGERLTTKKPSQRRSVGQQQGRENRTDWLETHEFDDRQPKHVRGWLRNERRRIEHGNGSESPRNPPGYEMAHGRETPAREGFDYGSSTLQGEDLNDIEEMVRRRAGRP